MKNLTIIVFIILVSCPLFAQDPFNPINFDGIDPQWSHFFVDSSRVISELSEGAEVLAEREIFLLEDSVAYFVFRDRADGNSGVLIEKMDLNSGNILWSSKFDERETGFHEFPAYFGMRENGTLELVGYKIAQDFSPIFGWSLGHFLRRVIDPETGEELALFFNDQFEEEEKMFIFGNARILKEEEEDNFIFVNQEYIPDEDNGQILHEFKHFSNSSSLFTVDSVMLPLTNKGFAVSSIFPLAEGFTSLRHTSEGLFELEDIRDLDPEEFEIVLDIFDTDLQHTLGIDITEVLPAKWHSFIWDTYDDLILIKNLDSAFLREYDILPHVYFSVFNQGGNHISDIYLGQELGPNLLTPARIPNTNDFVFFKIVNPLSTDKGIEVWLLEEGGNSSLLTTLEFADEREIRLASNIEILENGDVLFFYTAQTSGGASENYHNTVMRLSAEDIGLPTSTQDRPEESLAIHVYPNPFRQVLHADFGEPIKGDFSVFDLPGKLVAEVPLQGQSELSWDASALPAGAYVMTIRSGDKLWTSKVIKVE